jgi:hypothetical protein
VSEINSSEINSLIEAWVNEGRAPEYHRRLKAKLKREWKPLADAIEKIVAKNASTKIPGNFEDFTPLYITGNDDL